MATADQILVLRSMVAEPTDDPYTDVALGALIDATANLNAAAAQVWMEKAARFSDLVNVREGSSSRDLGDLYKNALSMAEGFEKSALGPQGGFRSSRTRIIERL